MGIARDRGAVSAGEVGLAHAALGAAFRAGGARADCIAHALPDGARDVAVVLHGAKGPFLDTKLAMADVAYDVLLDTGILIQPLPIWEEEWRHPEAFMNPALLRNISREGVRI